MCLSRRWNLVAVRTKAMVMTKILDQIGIVGFTLVLSCLLFSSESNAAWKRAESGTLAWLRSVYFLDEKKGWAVGSGGTFLITTNGGASWKQIGKITNDTLRDVYFFDERRGWLLCERDRFSSGSLPLSYLLKTRDGGSSWEQFDLDSTNNRLLRLVFSRNGSGFAIGEGGAIWELLEDGETWKRREMPTRYLLLSGQFIADSHRVIVGAGGTVLVSKSGGDWALPDTGPKTKERINSVFFLDEKNGWVVGAGGHIFATFDSGRTWNSQASGVSNSLFDVYFSDTQHGIAVGDGGRIIETSDGGSTWVPTVTGVKGVFERLAFSGRTGVAVGHGGLIFRYIQDS